MAIEIVEEGNLPQFFHSGTCEYCNCKVRCPRMDAYTDLNLVYVATDYRRTYDIDHGFRVTCPTQGCGHSITLTPDY